MQRKSNENNRDMQAMVAKYEEDLTAWRAIGSRQAKEIEELKNDILEERRDADQWRRNCYAWHDLYNDVKDKLYAQTNPNASKNPRADLIKLSNAVTDAMTAEGIAPAKVCRKVAKKKVVHLICVRTDDEGKLDEYGRYTSPGKTNGNGSFFGTYYPINELNGELYSCDQFVLSNSGNHRKNNH